MESCLRAVLLGVMVCLLLLEEAERVSRGFGVEEEVDLSVSDSFLVKYLCFGNLILLLTTLGPKSTSVDRRPSKVLVSGVTLDEKDAIVEHFMKFGEIIETSVRKIVSNLIES